MRSYASIDRIEGEYAVCEVELLPVEESNPENFAIKDCEMMNFPLNDIPTNVGDVNEGDMLVVEHNGEKISSVCSKDEQEKTRRLELLKLIMG